MRRKMIRQGHKHTFFKLGEKNISSRRTYKQVVATHL